MPGLTHAVWRKSSGGGGNEWVEGAVVSDAVAVRDSKSPGDGVLFLPSKGWHAFRSMAKSR